MPGVVVLGEETGGGAGGTRQSTEVWLPPGPANWWRRERRHSGHRGGRSSRCYHRGDGYAHVGDAVG